MVVHSTKVPVKRRGLLQAAAWSGTLFAGGVLTTGSSRGSLDERALDESKLIERLTGKIATASNRVHLQMPPVFGNGYSVPITVSVDSPMTDTDHVRRVLVVAPRNPIVLVAVFQFSPAAGQASATTRIRLAQPQNVLALADMSDGALLMSQTWVKVDIDGCN